ncbi:F-box domain, cyclin-like [Penicillium roqueforti FM164]|uniref:F-box domain, cyclin-like n=1 Tax=Penicillium roqueforti (strain FM164) TaxID=1365484 RepID=W6PVH7_PENRF|nr:F-box domain, cyclin-like [Penicillium roqueforti FM164]
MSLLKLPAELLLKVSSHLEYVSDLDSLYQCHPFLYTLLKDRVDELLKTEQSIQHLAWAAVNGKETCVRKLLDVGALFDDSFASDAAPGDAAPGDAAPGDDESRYDAMFLDRRRDPTPEINEYIYVDLDHLVVFGNPLSVAVLGGHTSVNPGEKRLCDLSLCLAVMKRHVPIIKLLLAGEIVRLLIDAGAEFWTSMNGDDPVFSAMETGNGLFLNYTFPLIETDTEIFLMMLHMFTGKYKTFTSSLLKRIDLDYTITFGARERCSLLCVAVGGGFPDLLERILLLRPYYSKEWSCPKGHGSLMALAIASGHIGTIELFLEYRAKLRTAVTYPTLIVEDNDGRWNFDDCPPSMILALNRGHDDVVKYLINKGFDVVFPSSRHGNGFFNRALYLGKAEILQMLLGSSSPSIEDIALFGDGLSIQLAVLGGEAFFKLLLEHGVQLRPGHVGHCRAFACAALLANVPTLTMFLDAGFSLDKQASDNDDDTVGLLLELDENRGVTLLALAAQTKDRNAAEAAVDFLLERGVQLNQLTGSCNHTPLLRLALGVAGNNVSTVNSFVEKITKTKVDEYEVKRLQYFEETSDYGLLARQLLLEKGADPLFLNRSGKSALTVTAWRNDIREVKMLLGYVDPNVPISTINSHILTAMALFDDSRDTIQDEKRPSLAMQKTPWNIYWRKVYPCPSE